MCLSVLRGRDEESMDDLNVSIESTPCRRENRISLLFFFVNWQLANSWSTVRDVVK